MAGLIKNHNNEKQIGCISGFLQIFDRQQILAGKRIHSTKRLPPATGVGGSPETVSTVQSPEVSRELRKPHVVVMPESPSRSQSSPSEKTTGKPTLTPPAKSPPLIPVTEIKDGKQKCFARHSLDGRAASKPSVVVNDGDNNQRRSTSVIAKLMGLEPLSSSSDQNPPQSIAEKPTLRRSVSESRVSRDLIHSKYIDNNNFQVKQPKQTIEQHIVKDEGRNLSNNESVNGRSRNLKSESPRRFFDSEDFFPEPNQTTSFSTMHGDFEKKLKKRGMDEQSNDLGTLKQILEVLQLKGLLHSTRPSTGDRHRNFVYVRNLPSDESSIVLMKPWRSPASKVDNQRSVNESRGTRRFAGENSPARSPVRGRNSSPARIESNLKSCNSIVKRKPLSIEIQRRANECSDSVRSSPINSPKPTPKRTGSVHHSMNNRSPRNQKPSESSASNSPKQKSFKNIVTENESSSLSETTVCTPPPIDTTEVNKQGRSLLQRCDKLLSNIAEMNSATATESPPSSAVIPSPVSVLDSVFDKDESSSSSPSHSIDFKAPQIVDYDDEICSRSISPAKSIDHEEEFISNDSDFIYISEILKVSPYLNEDHAFSMVEKLLNKSNDSSSNGRSHLRHRKLVFDVIVEILDKNRQFPPWKADSIPNYGSGTSLKQIWSEFQRIREINNTDGDGMFELISGVLRKDLIEITGWIDHPVEKSEGVLDIERMIFKDLVSEAIDDFADFPAKFVFLRPQRKLVF